ncbi:MAG: COX15/CtaA family protein [Verrucomicrobiales bacterium]
MKKADAMQWTCRIALFMVISLIFIGGLVRATGAGLGCPDWPRCWGSWWPPESAAAIPLEKINPAKIPAEFRAAPDPRVFFNKEKMWIEYLNRLWGVLAGFAVIAMVVAAMGRLRDKPLYFVLSFLTLLAMGFQGWLGALVVRSGLKQNMITIHMAMALVILALILITSWVAHGKQKLASGAPAPVRRKLAILAGLLLITTLGQVLGGTHVRELLDHVSDTRLDLSRSEWIDHVGFFDHFHRAFSWTVLLSAGGLWWIARRQWVPIAKRARLAFNLVLVQIALGISLAYFELPPASQFLHLGVAAALGAVAFRLVLDFVPGQSPAPSDLHKVTAARPSP